jgi:DNA polymerase-1
MAEPIKKLFLLDAMALIYRAYFAFNKNPRLTSKGMNTSAVFGFANVLFEVIRKEQPTHIGVAFDTMAPTIREGGFQDYKAQRQETPEDIIRAIPIIQEMLEGFRIPVLYSDGYEADDVIGTFAKIAEKQGFVTYMMTSDKDFGQLVSDRIFIYRPGKMGSDAEVLGVKEVCERYGIERPEQVIDLLGLWGDASDNIPGIPGVGEVTAKKLLAEFGSVENLIAGADRISNEKLKMKVVEFKDQAMMSKQLATIILDVPLTFDEPSLLLQPPDEMRLKKLFDELEFRTFAQRIFTYFSLQQDGKSAGTVVQPVKSGASMQTDLFSGSDEVGMEVHANLQSIENTPHHYYYTETQEKRAALIEAMLQQPSVCFDTETTGLVASESELVGMSFSWKPGEAWYVPFPDNYQQALAIAAEFKPVLENEKIEKVGQNMKFDISILKWYEIDVKGAMFDTMLAHYLLQPDMRHGMDLLAETYLGYKPVSIESLIGKKGSAQRSMRTVEPAVITEYAAEDADITLQLKQVFEPRLAETATRELFDHIEVPLIRVLASMESEGVRIDPETLREYSTQLEQDIRELERLIHEDAGFAFNIASPRQLGEVLYERLKIVENPKLTKTKQHSTSEDVLLKMENKHPIIRRILEYRSLTKLKSTYVDVLPTLISPRDGRIHTSYNQAVAATGRLSSNNPNLQNIPIRTERGREIRKAFIPRNERFVLLSADYSQIELRIIAHLSGDKEMIADFHSGLDIHTATAAKVYGIAPEDVSRDMRRNAKTVNFGIIYGISSFGLSERLNIPRKEAADIIHNYFLRYPGIRQYMEQCIAKAKRDGFVETMMKRRRYLRDINSGNATVRGFAERNAINAPIQGTAADMIKIAMIRIHNMMEQQPLRSKMIMQVHDELVFDVHIDELELMKTIVKEGMERALPLDVPVLAEMNWGRDWMEAH